MGMEVTKIRENFFKIKLPNGEIIFGTEKLINEYKAKLKLQHKYEMTDSEMEELSDLIALRVLEGTK